MVLLNGYVGPELCAVMGNASSNNCRRINNSNVARTSQTSHHYAEVFAIIAVVWGMSVVSIMIFFVFRTWAVLFKIIAVIV